MVLVTMWRWANWLKLLGYVSEELLDLTLRTDQINKAILVNNLQIGYFLG